MQQRRLFGMLIVGGSWIVEGIRNWYPIDFNFKLLVMKKKMDENREPLRNAFGSVDHMGANPKVNRWQLKQHKKIKTHFHIDCCGRNFSSKYKLQMKTKQKLVVYCCNWMPPVTLILLHFMLKADKNWILSCLAVYAICYPMPNTDHCKDGTHLTMIILLAKWSSRFSSFCRWFFASHR